MADDARRLGIGMRDPLSRQRMFELAASYDRIANSLVEEDVPATSGEGAEAESHD